MICITFTRRQARTFRSVLMRSGFAVVNPMQFELVSVVVKLALVRPDCIQARVIWMNGPDRSAEAIIDRAEAAAYLTRERVQ
jgi:hypothetical protein